MHGLLQCVIVRYEQDRVAEIHWIETGEEPKQNRSPTLLYSEWTPEPRKVRSTGYNEEELVPFWVFSPRHTAEQVRYAAILLCMAAGMRDVDGVVPHVDYALRIDRNGKSVICYVHSV